MTAPSNSSTRDAIPFDVRLDHKLTIFIEQFAINVDLAVLADTWVLEARSSVGEHYLDTVGVGSSILLVPILVGNI